jgi:predicted CoA-binding protein
MKQGLIDKFLDKKNVFAVVGASRDRQKYGYQVYVDLKNAGYKVYPVNLNAEEISGDRCYPNVDNLPITPDVVNVVVPSKATELLVKTCKKLGIKKVWMQPGSESKTAIKFCDDHGIDVVHSVCVMIERKSRT